MDENPTPGPYDDVLDPDGAAWDEVPQEVQRVLVATFGEAKACKVRYVIVDEYEDPAGPCSTWQAHAIVGKMLVRVMKESGLALQTYAFKRDRIVSVDADGDGASYWFAGEFAGHPVPEPVARALIAHNGA